MQVDFYHLTRHPLDRVLPRIAERIAGEGGRLLIVSADAGQRRQIDQLLWTYASESFLAHAEAGQGDDTLQPILIVAEPHPANAARNIALIDGAWREEALTFDRAFHLFDETSIAAARAAWKGLADRDAVERRYWKQNDAGRWKQAA